MDSQYQLKLKSQETDKIHKFHTADGLNSNNSFREEELLIADEAEIKEDDRILIIQSNYGLLSVLLGEKAAETVIQDTSARACQYSKKNAEENQLENHKIRNTRLEEIEAGPDKIIYAPADYEPVDLVKHRLGTAVEKLNKSGQLIIAGRKKSGIKRYKNYLNDLPGNLEKVAKRKQNKVYEYTKTGEGKVEKPEIEKRFQAKVDSIDADFKTAEGLFSNGKIDGGTRLLLKNLEISDDDKICDLACGYGAISIITGKKHDTNIYMTDDNSIATKYAETNMRENGLDQFNVETGDCLDAYQKEKFDKIVSNPPTHQGKGITQKMFQQSYEALKKDGELWLVYNQNMRFENQLSKDFDKVERVEQQDNFVVTRALKQN